MSTHKYIDKICIIALVIAMVVTVVFMDADLSGLITASASCGYEDRLFDTSTVHSIDIVMDDWEGFLETCENEEYTTATIVIDGESYKNVAIRAKGNTSLSTVSQLGSDRYSLKIEFDHYNSAESYYGLDKLCLNNLIQDATCMKDYLAYQLMAQMGVPSPLCSYAYITINGEDWGLYLAVEDVEEGFLQRNYGTDYGELYKPDSMSFGAGRGNGKDFNMDDFNPEESSSEDSDTSDSDADDNEDTENTGTPPEKPDGENMPDIGEKPDSENMPNPGQQSQDDDTSTRDGDSSGGPGSGDFGGGPDNGGKPGSGGGQGGGDMSMGSEDVKLQYIDDNADSYSNIFDNAKTDITTADEDRLISSLKSLSEGTDIEDAVNTDEVIRYFVVHNFLCNGDSYTGSMVHNYYLYEEDGQLSMIPWDYNLSFGAFDSSDATAQVNSPIDSPVSGDSLEDRPMVAWIFSDETYTELYHQYFAEFLENVDLQSLISETAELIAPYVEKDPTAFYTYDEFEQGVETLKEFCRLRCESIEGQLDGTIPSTSDGQSEDDSALIDASDLNLSDMGSMNTGGQGGSMEEPMEKPTEEDARETAL